MRITFNSAGIISFFICITFATALLLSLLITHYIRTQHPRQVANDLMLEYETKNPLMGGVSYQLSADGKIFVNKQYRRTLSESEMGAIKNTINLYAASLRTQNGKHTADTPSFEPWENSWNIVTDDERLHLTCRTSAYRSGDPSLMGCIGFTYAMAPMLADYASGDLSGATRAAAF